MTVRDAQWEHASCTCIDYKINELGTCKHIERVRLSLGKTAGRRAFSRGGAFAPAFRLFRKQALPQKTAPIPLRKSAFMYRPQSDDRRRLGWRKFWTPKAIYATVFQ